MAAGAARRPKVSGPVIDETSTEWGLGAVGRRHRVLVVDDYIDAADTMAQLLADPAIGQDDVRRGFGPGAGAQVSLTSAS